MYLYRRIRLYDREYFYRYDLANLTLSFITLYSNRVCTLNAKLNLVKNLKLFSSPQVFRSYALIIWDTILGLWTDVPTNIVVWRIFLGQQTFYKKSLLCLLAF